MCTLATCDMHRRVVPMFRTSLNLIVSYEYIILGLLNKSWAAALWACVQPQRRRAHKGWTAVWCASLKRAVCDRQWSTYCTALGYSKVMKMHTASGSTALVESYASFSFSFAAVLRLRP